MKAYRVDTQLYCGTCSPAIEFPRGKTWNNVANWNVKWDTLYITWDDGTDAQFELNSSYEDIIDWKRPQHIEVYELNQEYEATTLVAEGELS